MKAALMYGVNDVRVVDAPKPKFNDNEILVKVRACGVCPTDIRKYRTGDNGTLKLPMNLGHEWAGDIAEVGKNVADLKPGMRVLGHFFHGYAEYAPVDESFMPVALELPETVGYDEATFVEPLADCIYCVESQSNVVVGDKIAIIGAGAMGLMKMMVAKRAGIKVMMSDPLAHRREQALQFGADFAVTPNELEKAAADWSAGAGVDAVILSAGVPDAVNVGLKIAKNRGHVVLFGGFKRGLTSVIDPNLVHYKEVVLTGSFWVGVRPYHDYKYYHKALQLIADGSVPVGKLITARFPLEQVVDGLVAAEGLNGYKVMIDIA